MLNSSSQAGANPGMERSAASRRADIVESASVEDVLYDQLDYLVAHTGRLCPPGCPECARREQVKAWLLMPFRPMRS